MEPVRGYNINKTALFPVKAMVYAEKHHLFEVILKLIIELNSNRPSNVRQYIAENIKRIANDIKYTKTFILTPPIFDTEELANKLSKKFKIPIVKYTKKRTDDDAEYILEKLNKFLKENGLDKKHQIYLNFPSNCKELAQIRKHDIEPTTIVEIKHDFQVPFKTWEMYEEDENSFVHDFNRIKQFYKNICRTINFGPRLSPCQNKNGKNENKQTIEEVMYELMSIMRYTSPSKYTNVMGQFVYRVVIFGRRGSGRKTQAKALAVRFNLVYIDVEMLILQTLASNEAFGEILRENSNFENIPNYILIEIIYKRILRKDCLSNGWIIVNFPHTKDEFEMMMKLTCPPNKMIFLHCRERVCLRRLIKKWKKSAACNCGRNDECCTICKKNTDRMAYVKEEMKYFDLNKESILKFLKTRKETIHIDGNHTFNTVKNAIWSKIEAIQTGMGMSALNR